jgi:hypothetical protein
MEAFTMLMNQSSPMQMAVYNINNLPLNVFDPPVSTSLAQTWLSLCLARMVEMFSIS